MKAASELRSKLWSTGYKLSSNKVEEFLQYLLDNNMVLDDASDDDEQSIISVKEPSDPGDSLEQLIATMEKEVQRLETKVLEFTGPSCELTGVMEDNLPLEPETLLQEKLSPVLSHETTQRRQKPKKKSDPVQMYHRMQAIWARHKS